MIRNRGQFPSEQAALKVLYRAVRNLEEFRRPNGGLTSSGWNKPYKYSRSTSSGGSHPMTATITYTDDRTLPLPLVAWNASGRSVASGTHDRRGILRRRRRLRRLRQAGWL